MDEALDLVARVLNEVEDELTSIPFDPTIRGSDGRMYPQQGDARREVPEEPEITRHRTRDHNVFVRTNGAIQIRAVESGAVQLDKAGGDGQGAW